MLFDLCWAVEAIFHSPLTFASQKSSFPSFKQYFCYFATKQNQNTYEWLIQTKSNFFYFWINVSKHHILFCIHRHSATSALGMLRIFREQWVTIYFVSIASWFRFFGIVLCSQLLRSKQFIYIHSMAHT